MAPVNTEEKDVASARAQRLSELRADVAKVVEIVRRRRLGERVLTAVAFDALAKAIEAGASQSAISVLKDAALEVLRAADGKSHAVVDLGVQGTLGERGVETR